VCSPRPASSWRSRYALRPAPISGDLLAILDRVMRQVAHRLDREEPDDLALADALPELFAQLQAEAATTWRSPAIAGRSVRGSDRLRAWCVTSPAPSCTRASWSPTTPRGARASVPLRRAL
jgi:hypothetical protein